jgi:hypothetical protein
MERTRKELEALQKQVEKGELKEPDKIGAAAGARQAFCVNGRSSLRRQAVGAVEKWESGFWISTFPRPTLDSSFWSSRLV